MDYEIVQQHEYQDIYRLCHGVLVIVHKYEQVSHWLTGFKPSMGTKIKGIKNCYKLKDSLEESWTRKIYPEGTIVLDGVVINPIDNSQNYRYELKTSGAYFSGNMEEFYKLLDNARKIINQNYIK